MSAVLCEIGDARPGETCVFRPGACEAADGGDGLAAVGAFTLDERDRFPFCALHKPGVLAVLDSITCDQADHDHGHHP